MLRRVLSVLPPAVFSRGVMHGVDIPAILDQSCRIRRV